jgi:mannose-6-phosphate isomerase
VDQALACIDFDGGAGGLVTPRIETVSPVKRERLFDCQAFQLCRLIGQAPLMVGAIAEPRVLVCFDGSGQIEHDSVAYAVGKGDIWLLPAEVGACEFRPSGEVTLLEIAITEYEGIGNSMK